MESKTSASQAMYLSRIKLLDNKAANELLDKLKDNSFYTHHQLISEVFTHGKERDHLFRANKSGTEFLVLSKTKPLNKAAFLVSTLEVEFNFEKGAEFHFMLNANPVMCINRARHCVVKNARKHKLGAKEALQSWITKRAKDWGVSFSKIKVDEYKTLSAMRAENKMTMSFASFNGTLTIKDPVLFLDKYTNGFGRGKSFGMGLMLLNPVSD